LDIADDHEEPEKKTGRPQTPSINENNSSIAAKSAALAGPLFPA